MRDKGLWVLLAGTLALACIAGAAGAATLGESWKVRTPDEGSYLGITTSPDASLIYAGGPSILVRSWDGDIRWGYMPARFAAISNDNSRVVLGIGNQLSVRDNRGVENWSRNMDGYVTAAAISPHGSFITSVDNKGNYVTWSKDGDLVARIRNDTPTAIAYAPSGDLLVAVTDKGLRFYDHKLELIWFDNRTESRDTFIQISADGTTVIVAGYNQVASYSSDGALNWRKEVTTDPIIDMHCSADCYAIFLGGQDKEVVALDRFGEVRWRYKTGQWVNAIGVSRDASVVAIGGIDRTVTVLDRSGTVRATRKTDAIIQPRSIAVSSDGRRIVVADQANLYGFAMIGDAVAPDVPETYTQAPLNPVPTTNPVTIPPTPVATTTGIPSTGVPVTTIPVRPTTYTPVDPAIVVAALSAAFLLVGRK